jgi:hypothetical protein
MDLLTIKHQDFELTVECSNFGGIWDKARRNVGAVNLMSTYTWSDGVLSVIKHTYSGNVVLENGGSYPAIFFDNTEYPIWIDFNKNVTKAEFGSTLQSENDNFSFRHGILAGFLNYGNDIGRSEINIVYLADGEQRKFTFCFEVLSTKLDYHKHWIQIVRDIESEYRMLSLDYMKRTFHGFSPDTKGEHPELVWWSIFANEQRKFIKSIRSIINRPRHRLHGEETWRRADRLRRITPQIENEFVEHKTNPAYMFRVQEQTLSNDTPENRFLKYALREITDKYEYLKRRVESIKNTSDVLQKDMNDMLASLKNLGRDPFFRTIGQFKGLNQESMVLQKASGYSQVYRIWNLLRRAYSLNDGIYRLQTKDIATLYEIWCFIEVSHIVKDILGFNVEVDQRNRMEMNGIFTWELGKGEHSRILFKKDNVELAELIYNPKHTNEENDYVSIADIVVPTVAQKPDIVLQLTKNDLHKNIKMTYLFDAKYRIDGRVNGVDTPPEDAINQMHRYRDAIYYKEHSSNELKKEVVGGYILFPGSGERPDVEVSRFYKTIDEVNIGAFPLRPNDSVNRNLLVEFIASLVGKSSADILGNVIPQKGLYYTPDEPKDALYMILTLDTEVNKNTSQILCGDADTIIMGKKGMEEAKDIQSVRYIAPIIPGGHINGYYKVLAARVKEVDNKDYPIRIKFDVAEWTPLDYPAKFGLVRYAYRGVCKTHDEFMKHCDEQKVTTD